MSEGAQTTMVLTDGQAQTFNSLERMGASLSLIGVSLIFITFAACKRLRNLPNTFICMASVANVFASIACAIGYAGIWDLRKNPNSPLCQVQGLLFEWFMQSDPWWSVAMAINVFLVFFFSFTPDFFRKYLWLYGIICYGMPCIPGIVFLVYRNKKGLIYGDAILWCWISPEWNYLRIASYYIPIWACISVSILIYFAVGYKVFRQRSQLRNLTLSNPAKQVSTNGSSDVRDSAEKNLTAQPGCLNTITTEVQVTTDTLPLECHRRGSATPPSPSPTNLTTLTTATISGGQSTLVWSPSQHTDIQAYPTSSSMTANTISTFQTTSAIPSSAASAQPRGTSSDVQLKDGDNTASSTHHEHVDNQTRSKLFSLRNPFSGLPAAWARFQQKLNNMDQVKLAYLRTSFIFAVSVLVTWTPSSINRVYSLIHPDEFSYGLNIAASVVLPLQGVWNAVIYFTTSWRIIREEWAVFRSRGGGALRRVSGEGSRGGNAWGGGGGVGGLGVPNMGRGRRIEDNDLEMTPRVSTMRVVPGHGLDGGSI